MLAWYPHQLGFSFSWSTWLSVSEKRSSCKYFFLFHIISHYSFQFLIIKFLAYGHSTLLLCLSLCLVVDTLVYSRLNINHILSLNGLAFIFEYSAQRKQEWFHTLCALLCSGKIIVIIIIINKCKRVLTILLSTSEKKATERIGNPLANGYFSSWLARRMPVTFCHQQQVCGYIMEILHCQKVLSAL